MDKKVVKSDKYQIVEFNKTKIVCPILNGMPFFVVKCVSDDIGMTYNSVSRDLKKHPRFGPRVTEWSPVKNVLGLSSKHPYPCLPIHKLGGWLYSVNPQKVKESAQPNLIIYQEQCDDVLMNHFFGGTKSVIKLQQKRIPVKSDIDEKEIEYKDAVAVLKKSTAYKTAEDLKNELRKLRLKLNRIDKSFLEPELFEI